MFGRRFLIVVALASVFLLLPCAVAADDPEPKEPVVSLSPATNGNLPTVRTTEQQFCMQLVVQETGGAESDLIRLKAFQLLTEEGSDSVGSIPHLSETSCDLEAADTLDLGSLEPYKYKTAYLTAELDQAATYSGRLILEHGDREVTVYTLEVTREEATTQLEIFPTEDGKFTLNTKSEVFTRTLLVTLPEHARPVPNLTYTPRLERADGTTEFDPEVALLYNGNDVNEVEVPIEPGTDVVLTLRGRLPEMVQYTGMMRFGLGQGISQVLELDLTREAFDQLTEGLALATPVPPRLHTDWDIWKGATATLEFDLNVTEPQSIEVEDPTLVSLNRMEEGKAVDSLLGRVFATAVVEGDRTSAKGHHPVKLELDGLGPGEYQATVRVSVPDGREIEGTGSVFIRHHWWLAVAVMAVGIGFAWVLQNWAGGGRSRALISRKLSYFDQAIQEGLEAVEDNKLPDWIEPVAVKEVWEKVKERLDKDRTAARLERSAEQLQAVHGDTKARVDFLLKGLDLAEDFDHTLRELVKDKVLSPADQEKIQDQVKVWLDQLYDQIRDSTKTELENTEKGAPHTLSLMRDRLVELSRHHDQRRLDQIEQDLQELGKETPALKEEADAVIDAKLTQGAKVKLAEDDYQATDDFISQAQAEHANLRLRQMRLQLADLAGQKPMCAAPADWQPAAEAIQAVRDKLDALPADADTQKKIEIWQATLPLYTLAQVEVLKAHLGVAPLDLEPPEWQVLRDSHAALDTALDKATKALTPDSSDCNYAAGKSEYQTALSEMLWLRRDLVGFRLERLAEDENQVPLGVSETDRRWVLTRARAQDQLDALPVRPYRPDLSEADLVPARVGALTPLTERLNLADAALATYPPCGEPNDWMYALQAFKRALERAQKHVGDLPKTLAAGDADPMASVTRAEHSYEVAYRRYAWLDALCKRIETWELPEEAVYAPSLWVGYPLRQVHTPERFALRVSRREAHSSDDVRAKYEKDPRWWERFIGWMDLLSLGIAFVLALAGGIATKYADQATFGSWQDYLIVALWGFGVSEITNASLGELEKALYNKEG